MKKFLIRLLIFCLIFIAIDRMFIFYRNYIPRLETDRRLETVLEKKQKSDILIFGSSRGARNIIARQIQDSLKISAFNLSYIGGDIEFQNYVLTEILKYHTPKTVILTVDDNNEFTESENVLYRYDRLYPLVKYQSVRDELIRKGKKNKYLSDIFIFHQLNKTNFDFFKSKTDSIYIPSEDGSIILDKQASFFSKKFNDSVRTYNRGKEIDYKFRYYKNILKTCKRGKIKLIVVFPPNFFNPCLEFYNRIEKISKNYATCYRYNFKNKSYKNPDYYNDANHLRRNGAVLFTNEIIAVLKDKK